MPRHQYQTQINQYRKSGALKMSGFFLPVRVAVTPRIELKIPFFLKGSDPLYD